MKKRVKKRHSCESRFIYNSKRTHNTSLGGLPIDRLKHKLKRRKNKHDIILAIYDKIYLHKSGVCSDVDCLRCEFGKRMKDRFNKFKKPIKISTRM